MGFRPAFENHSIEVCELALAILPAFDAESLQRLRKACTKWSEELPALQIISAESAEDEAIVALAPAKHKQGLKYAYYRPNGAPVWELTIANNEIRLACTRYLSWSATWEFAEDIFTTLLDTLTEGSADSEAEDSSPSIVLVGLRFEDRFISKNQPHDFSTLFKENSKYLPSAVESWDDVWHMNSGWFTENKELEALNSLQLASVLQGEQNDASAVVTLNHSAQARLKVDGRPQIVKYSSDGASSAFSALKELHRLNKNLLIEVLNDHTQIAIGLTDAK